jgi:hypothetical protein
MSTTAPDLGVATPRIVNGEVDGFCITKLRGSYERGSLTLFKVCCSTRIRHAAALAKSLRTGHSRDKFTDLGRGSS